MASRALVRRLASSLSETATVSPRAFSTAAAKVPVEDISSPSAAAASERKDPRVATPPPRSRPLGLSDFFSPLSLGSGTSLLGMMDTMDRLFDTSMVAPASASRVLRGSNRTPWDVMEDDKNFKMRMDMPGLGKEEVKVAVEDGNLTIKGEHKAHDSDDDWSSRSYGSYNLRIKLPENVKVDAIKAEMKDGVLRVVAPKAEQARKFEVRLD